MKLLVFAAALVAVGAAGSAYVRTRVDTGRINDPNARCLYWKSGTITWNQSTPSTSDLEPEAAFSAVRRSYARWQAIMQDCGNIALLEGPRTDRRKIGFVPEASDNLNLVIFRDRFCNAVVPQSDVCYRDESCGNKYDCWDYPSDVLALTTSTYSPESGQIMDSDVELNSSTHTFTVTDEPCTRLSQNECVCAPGQACVQTDVENTMTHEVGHLVGLAHSPVGNSTMFATAPVGETVKREVDSDSAAFICEAYPKGAPPRNCVLQPTSEELGQAAGCSSVGGASGLLALTGLLTLLGQRRRSR